MQTQMLENRRPYVDVYSRDNALTNQRTMGNTRSSEAGLGKAALLLVSS